MSERACYTCKYDARASELLPCSECVKFGNYRPYWEPIELGKIEETPVTNDKNISMITLLEQLQAINANIERILRRIEGADSHDH